METNDKIREQLGSWHDLLLPFIESSQWDSIFTQLKMQSQAGKIIIPKAPDLFRSFEYCDRHKLKALMILMDPYPSFKGDIMISDGYPMSCERTGMLQPSLQLFYDAIEIDYLGFDPDMDMRPDNSYLSKEEHIMLLNPSLSVEKDKVGSHSTCWHPFTVYFIEEILNKFYTGLPIILCGQQAQKLEKHFAPMLHYIIKCEHPVAASYQNRLWDNNNCFKKVDEIIRQNNGPAFVPRWWRKKTDAEPVTQDRIDYGNGPECSDVPF